VSLAIAQGSSLGVSPTSLTFSGVAGGSNPASQSVAVANNGGGTLSWSATSNQSWLTISPASGTGAANPSVSVNTTGLAAGNYSGTITLTAPGATGSPATVAVSLAIAQGPSLGVSPTSLTFSGVAGGSNPASQSVAVTNNGGGTLSWSATSNQTWLTISPASGTGAANPSVSVNTTGLASGNYSGTITLTAPGATGSPATVSVSLAITQNPSLGVSPTSLTFSGVAGGNNPASQSVAVNNNGGGTLSWSATSNQSWLTISPASGTGAANPSVSVNTTGLASGNYSGTITLTAPGATGSPATVAVSLAITQNPSLGVSPTSLTFSGVAGGSNPASQSVAIANNGGGTLSWSATSNQTWLTISPASGTGAGNSSVSVNTTGLTAGNYSGTITLTAPGATGSPATVAVSLAITQNPSLGVSPTSLTFSGTPGGSNPASQSVAIANNGGGTLSWSAASNQSWLTISPASGTGAGNPSVSVNTTGLTAGNYSGTITLTAPGATGSPATVAVSLAITQNPSLGVSPTSLTFSGTPGGSNPASQSVAIANNGGGTLNWSAASNQSWLTISPASGTGAANPSVSVNTTGLAAGNYSGTITLTAPGATGSPATVAVSLAITQNPSLGVSPTSLTFSGVAGGSNPAPQSVAIANNGGGTLSWSAPSNQTWLTISPASGTGAANPSVSVNTTGLTAGNYSGTVTLTAPGATGSPATVAVSLAITQPPSLGVSPTSLTFSGSVPGANPSNQAFAIVNNGGGTLNWSVTSNQTWLTISPASGTGAANPAVSINNFGMTAGTYSATLTVTAAGSTQTLSVSLTLNQNPILTVAPNTLTFSGPVGGSNPAGQTFAISNTGSGTFNWSLSSNQPWLTFSPGSGTGGTGNPTVSVNTAGLAAGTYTGAINVTAANAENTGAQINVTLNVIQTPGLGLSPTTMTFTGIPGGGNPASQTLAITNSGGGTLNWSATSNQTWLTISQSSGTGAANPSVSVNTTGLAVGSYSGTITLTASGATGSPGTVNVSLTVTQSPSLSLSPNTLTFSGTAGSTNPAPQTAAIANNGGGTLNWSAVSNQSWLSVSPASGAGAANPSISVNTSGLTAGNYSGTVTVTAAGAVNSPATVAVSLNLGTPAGLTISPNTMSFCGTVAGTVSASQTMAIGNTGAGVLNWSATSNQTWLTVTPASGTGAGNVAISASAQGLAPGTYSGTVTIAAPRIAGSPAIANVNINVTAVPSLQLSPVTISFSTTAGGSNPPAQSITIANSGGGNLNWIANFRQPWISLSQSSGTGPATILVTPSLAGLAAGVYDDTISIYAAGAAVPTQSVVVTATVTAVSPPSGNQWYAATTGSPSGDGSINNPWDLQTALYQPTSVQPGDTIWVRGGTYGNGTGIFYAQLVGTAQAPIIVRQYPGERAIIDGWMQVGCCDGNSQPNLGSYVWIWDLEFANTITDRTGYPNGPPYWGQSATEPSVDDWAPNSKLINLVIHDTSGGPGWWDEATNSEAYGNIIYYNGYQASDGGHGHGFYTQNDTGTKLMSDNIVFDSFSLGVQIYGSGGESYVRNFDVDGNIAFNNGVLAAGTPPPHADNILFAGGIGDVQNVTLTNNFTYQTPADTLGESELGFAWSGDNIGMTAINNYFMGGFQGIDIWYWDSLLFTNNVSYVKNVGAIILGLWTNANESASSYVWDQNTYYGLGYFDYNNAGFGWANWSSASGLDPSSVYTPTDPTGVWTFVRPNKYEPGRANIVIYNWDLVSSVPVNVSGVLTYGQNYKVQDAENFFGNPVTSGTYTGSPINIPMTGLTPAAPNGTVPNPPVHTAPQFGVFVLLPQ
jgi:dUTPase